MASDGDLAARMRSHAEICVRNAANVDWRLDYTPETLPALEQLIDSLTPWASASDETRDGMLAVVGAYFGEVLVRTLDGGWVMEPTFGTPAVALGETHSIPHAMVQKRWENGAGDSLVFKYHVLSEGQGRRKPRWWRRG
jgi:hypothetical protein